MSVALCGEVSSIGSRHGEVGMAERDGEDGAEGVQVSCVCEWCEWWSAAAAATEAEVDLFDGNGAHTIDALVSQ